jgi:hypothetical protein
MATQKALMKSKRILFFAAATILITGACQNLAPVSAINASYLTSSTAVLEQINPLQPIATTYFSIQPVSPSAACDNSVFIKDITIADNTQIEPDTAFIKKWKIKNTGSCAWTRKYSLRFEAGERMSGETTYLTKWVPPDQTIVISVELIAPTTEGTHTGYWVLTDINGTAFGNLVYVKIVV